MMEILEIFVKSKNYTYMKMDGGSSISSRQPAINKFNSTPSIFIFLLTTRVGGLGVNLTGADRVIIYDPDWNPSTDAQARERAWRIGQEKQVTIYRLLTAGTIEEKIYHRQIFKQFVTNRVLKDPRQRRFFKSNDLYELFTFNEVGAQGTETSAIFAGTGSEVKLPNKSYKRSMETMRKSAIQVKKEQNVTVSFSPEKLELMKQLAKKLSLELSRKNSSYEKSVNISVEQSSSQTSHISATEKQNTAEKHVCKERITKKSKKRKPAKVDGEKIDYVVKTDIYKPSQTGEEENAKQDDYVLSKLFKKSGVHTALKHDTIVESSDPDYIIVEGEADRVAKQAIKALKESRRMCARATEGIPTWTGQHGGMKPRFGQKKKSVLFTETNRSNNSDMTLKSPIKTCKKLAFDGGKNAPSSAPSSSDLLSTISHRKLVFGTDVASDGEEESSLCTPTKCQSITEHDELLIDIRNFIAFRAAVDGQATTEEIIEAFKNKLPIQRNAVFKSLLSKICDFSRSSDGDGVWHLKEEFR